MYAFGDWWHQFNNWQQYLATGGAISSVLLLIRSVLALTDTEQEDSQITLLTSSHILTFLTTFFWMALLASLMIPLVWLGSILAIVVAMVSVIVVRHIVLSPRPTFTLQEVIDHRAEVQADIPPHRIGHGRIAIEVHGNILELDAITMSNDELPTGLPVRIVDVIDRQTLLVEPVSSLEMPLSGDSY